MRQKITMNSQKGTSVEERFQQFLSNCAARGLSEKTMRGYKNHLHCLSKYLCTWTTEDRETAEDWAAKLEERDWAALERDWANANSAPGGEVMD